MPWHPRHPQGRHPWALYTLTLARPAQAKIQMLTTSSRIVTILSKSFLKPLGLYTFSMNLLSWFFLIRKTGKWINLLLVLILIFGLNWDWNRILFLGRRTLKNEDKIDHCLFMWCYKYTKSKHTLCCKCLGSFAFLWCKMPMFWRAGMREGGKPLPLAFQYLILMV